MLSTLLNSWFKYPVGDGAFYAVFGLVFVILGITLLVFIFMGLGAVMKRVNARKKKTHVPKQEVSAPPMIVEDGVTPEIVAAITAALMAYYEEETVKCDFVVRRIKKI